MITIFHGTDAAASRKQFLDLKHQDSESLLIEGSSISFTDLIQILEGGELFTERKNFFIEQLLSKKKKSKELDSLIAYVAEQAESNNIYLWEGIELTKPTLSKFKNPIIRLSKLPQTLFAFLESIKPGNGRELIKLFHQTTENSDVEMIFFMMIRQVRLLLSLTEPVSDSIEEAKRMAPWQKSKLQNQVDYFEVDEIKSFYCKLFEIEKDMKTGNLVSSLTQTIDFLLLSI